MNQESLQIGKDFKLSTGGSPLVVRVGVSDNKALRKPVKSISLETIMELQVVLELSGRGTKALCSTLRKGTNKKDLIEPNIFGRLDELQQNIDGFYDLVSSVYEDSNGHLIERDLVVVKNTSEFIQHIIEQRKLDPARSIVRIFLDGGGGFLKIIVNVFDPEAKDEIDVGKKSTFTDSGVQKCQFLAIVADVPENHENLSSILTLLNLEEVSHYLGLLIKEGCFRKILILCYSFFSIH